MLWIVKFSAVSGFLLKFFWFMVAFNCSVCSLFKIYILLSFSTIVFAFDECSFIAPQFILVELIEQLNGRVIFASEVKFQLTDSILLSTGQFSVMIISPSKEKW